MIISDVSFVNLKLYYSNNKKLLSLVRSINPIRRVFIC